MVGLCAMLLVGTGSGAAAMGSSTVLLSVSGTGAHAHGNSHFPSPSAGGRYVVFTSDASNLVPNDRNGATDIFLRDVQRRITTRISVSSGGVEADRSSDIGPHAISSDGRYVAFSSDAATLVAGDTNGVSDCFVRDLARGVTTRVSLGRTGRQGNGDSYACRVSDGGRFVAFSSLADNLVPADTNDTVDVFSRALATGVTRRISVARRGAEATGPSSLNDMTPDGRVVVFSSFASNLVSDDRNGALDVYAWHRRTGALDRVSLDAADSEVPDDSENGQISANGRYITFSTYAPLVARDHNRVQDVYVRDLSSRTTVLASLGRGGALGNADSVLGSLNRDGSVLAFESYADDLVPGDTNSAPDVFTRVMATGTVRMESVSRAGMPGNSDSYTPIISADGSVVTFSSYADNLVRGDTNGHEDTFLRRR